MNWRYVDYPVFIGKINDENTVAKVIVEIPSPPETSKEELFQKFVLKLENLQILALDYRNFASTQLANLTGE